MIHLPVQTGNHRSHQPKRPGVQFAVRCSSDIILVIEEGTQKVGLSPNGVNRVLVDSYLDKTMEDILLLEFHSEPNGRDLDRYFLDLDLDRVSTLTTVPPDQIVLIFAIGY